MANMEAKENWATEVLQECQDYLGKKDVLVPVSLEQKVIQENQD